MRSLPKPIFENGKLKPVNVYINFHVFFRTLLLDNKLPQNIEASPVAQMVKKLLHCSVSHFAQFLSPHHPALSSHSALQLTPSLSAACSYASSAACVERGSQHRNTKARLGCRASGRPWGGAKRAFLAAPITRQCSTHIPCSREA